MKTKFLQAGLFARVSSCILLSDQLCFTYSFNYHYVGEVCGSQVQWSQASIKYTCTKNPVLKKAPKAIMMLADKSPKSGILLTQGLLQQHRVSDYHRIPAAELQFLPPHRRKGSKSFRAKCLIIVGCVGWCNEGAKISNKESVLSVMQDTQFFSPNFSMSVGKKRLYSKRAKQLMFIKIWL